MSHNNHHAHPPRPQGYEHRDASLPKIIWISIATIVILLIAIAGLDTYYVLFREREIQEKFLSVENPALEQLRAREMEILTTYGPADSAGIYYHIPLEQAKEMYLQRHANQSSSRSGSR